MSEKHLYIGGESPDVIKSKLGATAITPDGTFLDKTGNFSSPSGGATAEKSIEDYIDMFDMTPPTNGVSFLCIDRNLFNYEKISTGYISPIVQNLDNWILKRYDINNNCTQTNEYCYNYNAYLDFASIDSLSTPYGNITKFTIEPKITGDKFTACSFNHDIGAIKIIFAENSMDEFTGFPNLPNSSNSSLIEIIFATNANKITSMSLELYMQKLLKTLTLPTSMSLLVNLSASLQSSVVEEIIMPAVTGIITTMANMCNGNSRMKKFTFNLGDYNSLTSLASAWNYCYLLDTIENFPTSLNALTTLANAFFGTKLTEITLPASMPALTTMANMVSNDFDLVTLTLPTSAPSVTTVNGMGQNLINIETITECTNWGTNQIDASAVITNAYKLTTFKQSAMRVSKIGIYGTSTKVNAITSIDIDYANSLFAGSSPQIDISYNSLIDTELDRIFTALPSVTGKTIVVKGNPGAATCDPTIATAKGWTVTVA